MRALLALAALVAALGGCATSERNADGTFAIPARYANAPDVPMYFVTTTRLQAACGGRKHIWGCAVRERDGRCVALIDDYLRLNNAALLDYFYRHERAHCAGWHHEGE